MPRLDKVAMKLPGNMAMKQTLRSSSNGPDKAPYFEEGEPLPNKDREGWFRAVLQSAIDHLPAHMKHSCFQEEKSGDCAG